jgi:cell division protein FtsI/penicillin-binding protein 2
LPFVSYGGSSLLTAFLSLLFLLHISNVEEGKIVPAPELARYLRLGGFLIGWLVAIAFIAGWWAYYRSPTLLERTDNPRRAIADRFVPRGAIVDQRNTPLAANLGSPGEYVRQTIYPDLGPVIGYTHAIYGQSGLEASLDEYLRGIRGNPGLTIAWNHLLYGQPPPGLDVRLSLDLNLQKVADQMLGDRLGALVLMNAASGDILAISSHPTFDPNQLDQHWQTLVDDPRAPLFNRATLGRYPPGTALGFLFYVAAQENGDLPSLPRQLDLSLDELALQCAFLPEHPTWESAIANGCPATQLALARSLGEESVLELYKRLGFYEAPDLRLPTDSLPSPAAFPDPEAAFLGQSEIAVSPLQMALAASTLSAGGARPAPKLASAVNTPQAGWVVLPPLGNSHRVFSEQMTREVVNRLAIERLPAWQTLAVVPRGPQGSITWYIAGTLPSWDGARLTLVLLMEEGDPDLAEVIGRSVLQAALQP